MQTLLQQQHLLDLLERHGKVCYLKIASSNYNVLISSHRKDTHILSKQKYVLVMFLVINPIDGSENDRRRRCTGQNLRRRHPASWLYVTRRWSPPLSCRRWLVLPSSGQPVRSAGGQTSLQQLRGGVLPSRRHIIWLVPKIVELLPLRRQRDAATGEEITVMYYPSWCTMKPPVPHVHYLHRNVGRSLISVPIYSGELFSSSF